MKVKLFTHTDLDGVGCGIVGQYAFDDINIEYLNYDDVDHVVSRFIAEESYKYDKIFITDISVSEHVAKEIDEYIGNRTKLIDHHATAEWLNKYEWANVNPLHEDGLKSSGTSMFWDYLNQPSGLYDFVEKVRRYDTWEWSTKYNDLHAKELNDLLYLIGREKFIERFIEDSTIEFTNSEKLILEVEQNKINNYIEKQAKRLNVLNIKGYKAGVVFAEQYSSQLGNELAKKFTELDFIVMVDLSNAKVSYRGIKEEIDLGKDIAKHYGGGGHPRAAGSQINEVVITEILNKIFD